MKYLTAACILIALTSAANAQFFGANSGGNNSNYQSGGVGAYYPSRGAVPPKARRAAPTKHAPAPYQGPCGPRACPGSFFQSGNSPYS
jgi:hypothetical protein